MSEPIAVRIQASPAINERIRLSTTDDAIEILQREINELTDRVDNLITFHNRYEFPSTGAAGNLYVATDEQAIFYWDGNAYVAVSGVDALQDTLIEINGGGSI